MFEAVRCRQTESSAREQDSFDGAEELSPVRAIKVFDYFLELDEPEGSVGKRQTPCVGCNQRLQPVATSGEPQKRGGEVDAIGSLSRIPDRADPEPGPRSDVEKRPADLQLPDFAGNDLDQRILVTFEEETLHPGDAGGLVHSMAQMNTGALTQDI